MRRFVRGYPNDAGVDFILEEPIAFKPGHNMEPINVGYTPGPNEVAMIVTRGSTAMKGLYMTPVLIDEDYVGDLHLFVFNATNETIEFKQGDRPFSIINLVRGDDRVDFELLNRKPRKNECLGSTGGQNE